MSDPKFLKHKKNGRVFAWSKLLAKNNNLIPYDPETKEFTAPPVPHGVPRVQPEPTPAAPESTPDVANESLHWTQLRKKVADAGGVYTNREEALAFLNNSDTTEGLL